MKYSLLSLFALTTITALFVSLAARRHDTTNQQLLVKISEHWKSYDVERAAYGVSREDETYFLTVVCSATNNGCDPPDCRLEFSIPFDKDPTPLLTKDAKFHLPSYHEKHGNLNYFYYLGYGDIDDGTFTIQNLDGSKIEGELVFDVGAVVLKAEFEKVEISRSFD